MCLTLLQEPKTHRVLGSNINPQQHVPPATSSISEASSTPLLPPVLSSWSISNTSNKLERLGLASSAPVVDTVPSASKGLPWASKLNSFLDQSSSPVTSTGRSRPTFLPFQTDTLGIHRIARFLNLLCKHANRVRGTPGIRTVVALKVRSSHLVVVEPGHIARGELVDLTITRVKFVTSDRYLVAIS